MKFCLKDSNENYKEYSFELDCTSGELIAWRETQEYQLSYNGMMLWGNRYDDFISEMESYGVLDVNGDPNDEEFISYEIEPADYPVILENFKNFFVKNGFKVIDD